MSTTGLSASCLAASVACAFAPAVFADEPASNRTFIEATHVVAPLQVDDSTLETAGCDEHDEAGGRTSQ